MKLIFEEKVHYIRPKLIADFDFSVMDADAIIGNGAHETGGFLHFQEISPTVAGSRGGFGWFQWTGSRRRAFEAYCLRNKLDPFSDKANYGWLWVELTGPEKKAVAAVKRAKGLAAKVKAFEKSFERAGIKHHASRIMWAERSAKVPRSIKTKLKTQTKEKTMFGAITTVLGKFFTGASGGGWFMRVLGALGLGTGLGAGDTVVGAANSVTGVIGDVGATLAGQPWYMILLLVFVWAKSENWSGILNLLNGKKDD